MNGFASSIAPGFQRLEDFEPTRHTPKSRGYASEKSYIDAIARAPPGRPLPVGQNADLQPLSSPGQKKGIARLIRDDMPNGIAADFRVNEHKNILERNHTRQSKRSSAVIHNDLVLEEIQRKIFEVNKRLKEKERQNELQSSYQQELNKKKQTREKHDAEMRAAFRAASPSTGTSLEARATPRAPHPPVERLSRRGGRAIHSAGHQGEGLKILNPQETPRVNLRTAPASIHSSSSPPPGVSPRAAMLHSSLAEQTLLSSAASQKVGMEGIEMILNDPQLSPTGSPGAPDELSAESASQFVLGHLEKRAAALLTELGIGDALKAVLISNMKREVFHQANSGIPTGGSANIPPVGTVNAIETNGLRGATRAERAAEVRNLSANLTGLQAVISSRSQPHAKWVRQLEKAQLQLIARQTESGASPDQVALDNSSILVSGAHTTNPRGSGRVVPSTALTLKEATGLAMLIPISLEEATDNGDWLLRHKEKIEDAHELKRMAGVLGSAMRELIEKSGGTFKVRGMNVEELMIASKLGHDVWDASSAIKARAQQVRDVIARAIAKRQHAGRKVFLLQALSRAHQLLILARWRRASMVQKKVAALTSGKAIPGEDWLPPVEPIRASEIDESALVEGTPEHEEVLLRLAQINVISEAIQEVDAAVASTVGKGRKLELRTAPLSAREGMQMGSPTRAVDINSDKSIGDQLGFGKWKHLLQDGQDAAKSSPGTKLRLLDTTSPPKEHRAASRRFKDKKTNALVERVEFFKEQMR